MQLSGHALVLLRPEWYRCGFVLLPVFINKYVWTLVDSCAGCAAQKPRIAWFVRSVVITAVTHEETVVIGTSVCLLFNPSPSTIH